MVFGCFCNKWCVEVTTRWFLVVRKDFQVNCFKDLTVSEIVFRTEFEVIKVPNMFC